MANPVFNDYFITGLPTPVALLPTRFHELFTEPGTPWDFTKPVWGAKLWLDEPADGRLGMTLVTPWTPYGDPREGGELEVLNVANVTYDPQYPWATACRILADTLVESCSW